MIDHGVTFFNFGGGCIIRLLVALDSLRKFHNGPVTVFLANGDPFCEKAALDIAQYAQIQWFDLERLAKRNLKSCIKPSLFKQSPYKHTIMCDGDLLFQADIEPLFIPLTKGCEFLVTQFSTWKTDGSKMRKRVGRAWDFLDEETQKKLQGKVPAVNIGVMGWTHGADKVLADWEEMTMNLAGQHIADEIACQVIFPRHKHHVAGPEWNESCFYHAGEIEAAKILHYHGNKHTSLDRPSSLRWLKHLARMIVSGRIKRMEEYLTWPDKALRGMMKSNPEWIAKVL